MKEQVATGQPILESFLMWHRTRQYDKPTDSAQARGGRHQQNHTATFVVACRYWFELTDGFWGQLSLTQIPHVQSADLLPSTWHHLVSMQNFVGALEYLCQWRWHTEVDVIVASSGCIFHIAALPFLINDSGDVQTLGAHRHNCK